AMPLPYALKNQFFTTHNTNVPYHVAWRERTITLGRLINGSNDDSYRLVPSFCDM
ncbi:hypothetical protein MKW98_016044, partial [Papaver atlanticum]